MTGTDHDIPSKRRQFGRPHYEGYISTTAGQLYFREFGDADAMLIGLHGGPGAAHDYLAPLAELAGEDLTVVLYDQFGCGRSDVPPDTVYDYYTIESYCERLDEVRRALETDTIHLYGHSWGGWLALEYALTHPDHVASLMLANTSSSTTAAIESMYEAARSCLDQDDRALFDELIAERRFDDDRFNEFNERFSNRHVNRSNEEPFADNPPSNEAIYGVMWGPSEFVMAETARLRDWDVTDRLDEIPCPTLVLNGEYDEIAPALGASMAESIPDARFEEIANASHLPLWEQPERHERLLRSFLDEHR